ncbi:MAG: universal stress protein, partial [Myxococcales bacterium]
MQRIRKILVPTDFSEPSREALAYALALAPKLDASVELLHVVELPGLIGHEALVRSPDGKRI